LRTRLKITKQNVQRDSDVIVFKIVLQDFCRYALQMYSWLTAWLNYTIFKSKVRMEKCSWHTMPFV